MTTKIINIAVPINWIAPQNLPTLSPEENAFIIEVVSCYKFRKQ